MKKHNPIIVASFLFLMFLLGCSHPVTDSGESINPGAPDPVVITVPNEPEITVTYNGNEISSGSTDFSTENIIVNTVQDFTFTIENSGLKDLSISGTPLIDLSGDAFFSLKTDAVTPVLPSSSTTFVITSAPVTTGTFTTTLLMSNNDPDEGTYTFQITTTVIPQPEPEVAISLDGSEISSGSNGTTIGTTSVGNPIDITFTIENSGTADLSLSGSPIVNLSGDSVFTLKTDAPATISAGTSNTFQLTFTPPLGGTYNGGLSIATNDNDENPYTFSFIALATGIPEIEISTNGNVIALADKINFGNVTELTSNDLIITIENIGTDSLELSGTPLVNFIGDPEFTITQPTVSTIAPGSSTTFTITFAPSSQTRFTGTISIANNDSDEGPFTLAIQGRGSK